ncbi:CRSP complex subunit [Sarcoptes scabiei]|nr:CRSP complex subunit [Sarcoptes scabiei]
MIIKYEQYFLIETNEFRSKLNWNLRIRKIFFLISDCLLILLKDENVCLYVHGLSTLVLFLVGAEIKQERGKERAKYGVTNHSNTRIRFELIKQIKDFDFN